MLKSKGNKKNKLRKKGETLVSPAFLNNSFILYRLLVQKIPLEYVFMSFLAICFFS
jgi:predicted solute-binding protein